MRSTSLTSRQKVWRGLEGRVRQGRSGGGLCYGYDVVRELRRARRRRYAGGVSSTTPKRPSSAASSRRSPRASRPAPSPVNSMPNAFRVLEAVHGQTRRSEVIPCGARASCTMSSTSAGSSGISNATSRSRVRESGWPGLILKTNGSSRTSPNCGSSMMISGTACNPLAGIRGSAARAKGRGSSSGSTAAPSIC